MLSHEPLRFGETLIDPVQRKLLEALPEYALPAVERDHARIGSKPVERGERARRNVLG